MALIIPFARRLAAVAVAGGLLALAAQPRAGESDRGPALVREVAALVAEQFYDADLRGLDWKAITREHAGAARDAPPEEWPALINGMLATLATSHTRYFTADTPEYYQLLDVFHFFFEDWLRERMPPDGIVSYPGIGLVTRERDGRYFVIGKIDGTPASRSLIAVGDALVSVDGEPFRPLASFRGKAGGVIRVTVQRTASSRSTRTVEVAAEALNPGEMFVNAIRASARVEQRGGFAVAYVRMWSYAGEQYQQALQAVLAQEPLDTADALVLDVRDGWGGANPAYLNLFNTRVPVMESRMRNGNGDWQTFDTQWRKPVVLLVNGGTRSGKELLAHGFRTQGIGPVVGSRTAGAVTAGRLFRLSNDDLLYLAVGDVRVDGVRLEGRGVDPDIVVPFEVEFAAGRDPQLDRAFEVAAERVRLQSDRPVP